MVNFIKALAYLEWPALVLVLLTTFPLTFFPFSIVRWLGNFLSRTTVSLRIGGFRPFMVVLLLSLGTLLYKYYEVQDFVGTHSQAALARPEMAAKRLRLQRDLYISLSTFLAYWCVLHATNEKEKEREREREKLKRS